MSDEALLRAALFTPGPRGLWGMPMRLVGSPGTAKTDVLVQVANEAGFYVEVVLASLRDPTDFLGLPVPRPDGSVGYAPPSWALVAAERAPSVVFFDEINTCSPATQAALLRVVLDRTVGDFQLPPTVRIFAAQNGVDEAAGGYDLAMPLANRFGTIADWTGPSVEAWTSWLLGSSSSARSPRDVTDAGAVDAEQSRVLSRWPSAYSRAAGLVATFIKSKPALIHAQPQADSPQASLPWPSRRTWAMATRALAASCVHGLDDPDSDRYVGSFIGLAAMVELRAFMTSFDLPDPADLLDGRVAFRHDQRRLDHTMAVLSACAALVSPKGAARRCERSAALWRLLRSIMKKDPDVAWPAVKVLCSRGVGLERDRDGGRTSEDAREVLERFHPMLEAAGLIHG